MNVVLINQFFPPAKAPTGVLLADLAAELAGRGHAVTVVTSAGEYGTGDGARASAPAGVQVRRVGTGKRHRSGLAAKLADYLFFFRRASRELARLPERPDALVCMTTPPFIGLVGARFRKRRDVPYVLWCMDLYPETLAAYGFLRDWNPVKPVLKALARQERRRAFCAISLGPDMSAILETSGASRIEEVPVWSSLSVAAADRTAAQELRRARGWGADEVVLLYSGNMGRAHRAGEFIALAERLQGNSPKFRFVFAGGGPMRAEWEQRGRGLFEFMPAASGEAFVAHLLAADVHLVSQQPEWGGLVVPSKFQSACAAGRPVVFAGPPRSAVGLWIREADAGWTAPPDDGAAIERIAREIREAPVRAEKGANAERLFQRRFTRERNCGRVSDLIEQTVKERA